MKKLGKKRKHPPKDTTSQNKSSTAPIKKHNQKLKQKNKDKKLGRKPESSFYCIHQTNEIKNK